MHHLAVLEIFPGSFFCYCFGDTIHPLEVGSCAQAGFFVFGKIKYRVGLFIHFFFEEVVYFGLFPVEADSVLDPFKMAYRYPAPVDQNIRQNRNFFPARMLSPPEVTGPLATSRIIFARIPSALSSLIWFQEQPGPEHQRPVERALLY